jgi:hypothetical protein
MTLQLRPEQAETVRKFVTYPRWLDRSHAGTGKTPPACVYSLYVVTKMQKICIWLQPTSLLKKNLGELLAWTGLSKDQIKVVEGTPAAKRDILLDPNVKIFLMTADAFKTYGYPRFKSCAHLVGAIICDEPHNYFRGYTSQRTQAFDTFCHENKKLHVKFLTATPTPYGKLTSAYIYCRTFKHDYYHTYRYFKMVHEVLNEDGDVIGWQDHQVLEALMSAYSHCNTVKDVYGEVDEYIHREQIELEGKHKEIYLKFEDAGLLELQTAISKDIEVSGGNTLRCRQILNHPHRMAIPNKWDDAGNPIGYETHNLLGTKPTGKDLKIKEYLEEGEPVIIFAPFQHEHEHLLEVVTKGGYKGAIINGTIPKNQRDKVDADFRAGLLDCVIASPKTAGVGYNWGHVNTVIFHSMDYGDDDFTQAIARAKRGIRTETLRIILLEYVDTIEQLMLVKVHRNSVSSNKISKENPVINFPRIVKKELASTFKPC